MHACTYTEIYVYLHTYIDTHNFRELNILDNLIKAQEETKCIQICKLKIRC